MQQSQKGIKLHNSFIHWRTAGDEIYCGILYFLVALMDRWVDLVNGGQLVGLSAETNTTLRLSVGFGLAYYLIGAVLLDYKAQHLHTLSEQMSPVSIEDIPQIKKAKANDQRFRRHLYFNTLCRFLGVHVWALALCATLIWIFNGTETGLIMFLAYVGAYTGLLLYQYNKIFSGPHALMPLLAAVVLGFVLGNILMKVMPESFLLLWPSQPGPRQSFPSGLRNWVCQRRLICACGFSKPWVKFSGASDRWARPSLSTSKA
jgi:hypothetical protein